MRPSAGSFHCTRQECNAYFDSEYEFTVHESYHEHHDKILQAGIAQLDVLERNLGERPRCPLVQANSTIVTSFPQLPSKLICEWSSCNQQFLNAEIYYEHVSCHSRQDGPREAKLCRWGDCRQSFRTMTLLKDHLRVHTLEKQFACPGCRNFYSTKIKFIDHFLRHIEMELPNSQSIKPVEVQKAKIQGVPTSIEKYNLGNSQTPLYKCTQENCNRVFLTPSLLREHVRTHSNAFKCSECSFVAPSISRLNSHHTYRHSKVRPYKCNIFDCEATFKQRGDLRRHVRTHQIPTKPFKCENCGFETQNEELLTRHMDIHRYPKRYLCHECQNMFSRGNNLSRHLITVHKYRLPDGHAKFRYKLLSDGTFLLDTGVDIQELQKE